MPETERAKMARRSQRAALAEFRDGSCPAPRNADDVKIERQDAVDDVADGDRGSRYRWPFRIVVDDLLP